MTGDRGRVHVTDIVVASVVAVGSYALAPVYYDLSSVISASADPLSQLLLELVIPFLFLGIVVSVGLSAGRAR